MDDTPVAHDSQVVGPPDEPGEESFHLTLCTPEWLSETCRRVGGIHNARHHLVVDYEGLDQRALQAWLSARAQEVQGETWHEVGERLGRLAYWEFEDYHP